ncbi:hypothetical protein HT746_08120 [Burkholderia pyrrocinia]|uniref:hypothetical protein n=1 Tax=Burkholderia pyrrocinia TaxID=60550 RepID=UPI0015756039|nr:hypothetical protein [Burkholderia pyrrocinia]NTX27097.1 hypothetical protein [Burkholderia pyrrocinia]QVN17037.1 hypothetical protein JYG32_12165 [Burkholderia pyrrocinia]
MKESFSAAKTPAKAIPSPLINSDEKCQWRIIRKDGGRLREGNHGLLPPLDFRMSVNLPVQNGRARVVLN